MKDEILQILIKNYNCEEGSFIYFLHENATFNEGEFKNYLRCILEISEQLDRSKINNEITDMIVKTYGYILRSFLYHFHKNDCYEIINYPNESIITDYVETMRIIIEDCYFNGSKIDWKILDVEL